VQPTYDAMSDSISGQSAESLNGRLMARIDIAPAIVPIPMRLSLVSNARLEASELRDQVEIWINEGGAGGEASA